MTSVLIEGIDPMSVIYHEYCEIVSSSDSRGKLKAPLGVLSAFAESEGLTGIAALDGLRRVKTELESNLILLDAQQFSCLYQFVYFICRERGQKNMLVSTGVEAWRLILNGRFRLLDQWCDFVKENQRYTFSEDTWLQVLTFTIVIHDDLSKYDSEGSWPVLIDEFVEYMIRHNDCQNAHYSSVSNPGVPWERQLGCAVDSKLNSTKGDHVRVARKKRWLSAQEEDSQIESVNCIAQRLARMPCPFSKRVRSSYFMSDSSEFMECN